MLQNRVDPGGNIIRTPARGAWIGNRGVLHNERQQILRPFRLKAWITCVLEFKGRRRAIMAPNRWTELFFLDEATAFSAGHRPCFECRRTDAMRFKSHWISGNPEYGFDQRTPINEIDTIIHAQRIDRQGEKVTYKALFTDLPAGAFVVHAGQAHLLRDRLLFPWSPFGYGPGIALPEDGIAVVLTPRSIVNAFKAGYLPQTGGSVDNSTYLEQSFK
jgi:hypothetical protein